MRRLLLFTLLLIQTLHLQASEPLKISGKVTDSKTGEAIIGAAVQIDKEYLWAVTDHNGVFIIENIEAGNYSLEVSSLGYIKYSQKLNINKSLNNINIRLNPNNLSIKEVVITSKKSKDNANTTQTIGRNALNHLQITGISNIAALLPGGKTLNPDLTNENQMLLRAAGSNIGNAAFGTAIEVNGVRMSNNANFNNMNGIGTRGIPVENIESVEVITGVPSAEYGDLGSGIIKVKTKTGSTPLNIVFSVNPKTCEASVSKGLELGKSNGTLNVSGEWAEARKKLVSPYSAYTRRSFTFEYQNIFARKLKFETGITGNIGGMDNKGDPDAFKDVYSKNRDNILTPRFKLMWLLNNKWVTNLSLDGSIFYHDRRVHNHDYNSFASSQPAVHSEKEGYYFATPLPTTFYSDKIIDSKELDYSASIKYSWLHHIGKVKSTIKSGLQWKATGNIGSGEKYEDPLLAENGYRPRPYKDYPYMHNLAYYLEDNIVIPIGKSRLNIIAGIRQENIFIKNADYNHLNTFSPRLNVKWQINKELAIRGGWGITEKLPSFYILYPKQEYRDFQTFGFSNGDNTSYVYYTQPYKMEHNPNLKWQRNYNSEIGIDWDLGKYSISAVAFCNVTKAPYDLPSVYTPFSYKVMSLPDNLNLNDYPIVDLDHNTGYVSFKKHDSDEAVLSKLKVEDRTFAEGRIQDNACDIVRAGVELTIDFPEIKAIDTKFRLDAAYGYTHYLDEDPTYYYQSGWSHTTIKDRSYQYVGIYAGPGTVYNGQTTHNLDANLTAITHIPEARLIVSCRLEASLFQRSQNISRLNGKDYAFTVDKNSNVDLGEDIMDGNSYTAIYPIAYMDLDGNEHPWTGAEAHNPDFARLILRSGNAYTFNKDGYDPYFSANISITKEIGNHVSLSFFVNNFTNSRKYVKSHATGIGAIFTPKFYYGMTCRLKF